MRVPRYWTLAHMDSWLVSHGPKILFLCLSLHVCWILWHAWWFNPHCVGYFHIFRGQINVNLCLINTHIGRSNFNVHSEWVKWLDTSTVSVFTGCFVGRIHVLVESDSTWLVVQSPFFVNKSTRRFPKLGALRHSKKNHEESILVYHFWGINKINPQHVFWFPLKSDRFCTNFATEVLEDDPWWQRLLQVPAVPARSFGMLEVCLIYHG